jgi:hypothetical protein
MARLLGLQNPALRLPSYSGFVYCSSEETFNIKTMAKRYPYCDIAGVFYLALYRDAR